jgi:hypothetical protein
MYAKDTHNNPTRLNGWRTAGQRKQNTATKQ